MSDEIDDNDFYQQDFTTASEWEVFNARLEEIFREWKLSYQGLQQDLTKNQLAKCEWLTTIERIYFADVELMVTRYCAKLSTINSDDDINKNADAIHKDTASSSPPSSSSSYNIEKCQTFIDLLSIENDYCILDEKSTDESTSSLHPLVRWYGLRDFIVISPIHQSLTNESQIHVLLSSVHIAIAECNCEVPIFVQIMDKKQNVYAGVCETQTVRLTFDIVNLYNTPAPCKYLSGILDVFKGKIGVRYIDPVMVSVRLTYNIDQFFNAVYEIERKYPFDEDEQDDNKLMLPINIIPFGVSIDPVKEILLYFTWPQVAENVVVDSQTYTDFDPMLAPIWSIHSRFENNPICLTSEFINEYLQLCESHKILTDIVGEHYGYLGNSNFDYDNNPLDLLTESKISSSFISVLPSLRSATSSSSSSASTKSAQNKIKKKLNGPIDDEQLKQMLYYLFPDAQLNSLNTYTSADDANNSDPLLVKTAASDSLVHRLTIVLAYCNNSCGGIRAIGQLWAEFTQEMRFRVGRCIQIPGIADGFPDSRTCLLHQKLQMLNICMERKRLREGGLPFSMTQKTTKKNTTTRTQDDDDDEDSDDEFFDCSNDEDEDNERKSVNKPEGRLTKLGDITLVDTDEPLYIPRTQDPVPKTEDQLEDDAEVMLKLGPGSELRTQMMSASLLSDMESFKAANPNGKLEDFIRWYSPRDWIEDDDDDNDKVSEDTNQNNSMNSSKKGHLSSRMLIPGNTWQTVWESAKPLSARRQKRLFDDTKEAEKVLHFLESRNIGQIIQLTIATLFHSGYLTIQEHIHKNASIVEKYLPEQYGKFIELNSLRQLSRENWNASLSRTLPSQKKWENLLTEIIKMEFLIGKYHSLCKKLFPDTTKLQDDENQKILASLLMGFETELPNNSKNDLSKQLLNLFAESELLDLDTNKKSMTFPPAIEKQFTLRVSGKTAVNEMEGPPQFLRAILKNRDFRLCGAFSQNTAFC